MLFRRRGLQRVCCARLREARLGLFVMASRCDGLIATDSVLSRGAALLYEKRLHGYLSSPAIATALLLLILSYREAQLRST